MSARGHDIAISIREAISQDIKAVAQIWESCDLTRPWNDPASDFNLSMTTLSSTIFVAEEGITIVGTVMTGFDDHRGWVYYLGILPSHRYQGIAQRLIDAATVWLGDRDCPKVELMVRKGSPAVDFYVKGGWELQDVDVYARWLNTKDK